MHSALRSSHASASPSLGHVLGQLFDSSRQHTLFKCVISTSQILLTQARGANDADLLTITPSGGTSRL